MKRKFPWLELVKHFVTAVLTFLASIGVNKVNSTEVPQTNKDTVVMQMLLPDIDAEVRKLDSINVITNDY